MLGYRDFRLIEGDGLGSTIDTRTTAVYLPPTGFHTATRCIVNREFLEVRGGVHDEQRTSRTCDDRRYGEIT